MIENQGVQDLPLFSTENLTSDITFTYSLGGTATPDVDYRVPGADYTTMTGQFTIPSGTQRWTSFNVGIEIMNDSVSDNRESIIFTVLDGDGYNVANAFRQGTVIIWEDLGSASFRITGVPRVGDALRLERTATDPEGDGPLSIGWTSTHNPNDPIPIWRAPDDRYAPVYILEPDDEGQYFNVTITYVDGNGLFNSIRYGLVGPIEPAGCVPKQLLADVEGYAQETHKGVGHVSRWQYVLRAFQHEDQGKNVGMPASVAQQYSNSGLTRWDPVVPVLRCIERGPVTRSVWSWPSPPSNPCVSSQLHRTVQGYAAETQHGFEHVNRWMEVLAAFGENNLYAESARFSPTTAAEAREMRDRYSPSRWIPVVTALECMDRSNGDGPLVTISGGAEVTEGYPAVFTITASPAPTSDLTVKLQISDDPTSDFLAANQEGAKTVTIPAGQSSATYTVSTTNDSAYETDGAVTATLVDTADYRSKDPPRATVSVKDNDAVPELTISVSDATASESGYNILFRVRLNRALLEGEHAGFIHQTRESSPTSAISGTDYSPRTYGTAHFRPGQMELEFRVFLYCDNVSESNETFEFVISNAYGDATISDGVGVGTITDRGNAACSFNRNPN